MTLWKEFFTVDVFISAAFLKPFVQSMRQEWVNHNVFRLKKTSGLTLMDKGIHVYCVRKITAGNALLSKTQQSYESLQCTKTRKTDICQNTHKETKHHFILFHPDPLNWTFLMLFGDFIMLEVTDHVKHEFHMLKLKYGF